MLPVRKHKAQSLPDLSDEFFTSQAKEGASWIHPQGEYPLLKWLAPADWKKIEVSNEPASEGFKVVSGMSAEDGSAAAILRWSPCPTPIDPGDFLDAAIDFTASHACAYQRSEGWVGERSNSDAEGIRTSTALWTPAGIFWINAHSKNNDSSAQKILRNIGHSIIFPQPLGELPQRSQAHATTPPVTWTQNATTQNQNDDNATILTFGDAENLKIKLSTIDKTLGPARAINMAMVNAHKAHGRLVPGTLQQLDLALPDTQWQGKVRIRIAKSPSNREVVLLAGTLGETCHVLVEADYPTREANTFSWLACRRELSELILSLASTH